MNQIDWSAVEKLLAAKIVTKQAELQAKRAKREKHKPSLAELIAEFQAREVAKAPSLEALGQAIEFVRNLNKSAHIK